MSKKISTDVDPHKGYSKNQVIHLYRLLRRGLKDESLDVAMGRFFSDELVENSPEMLLMELINVFLSDDTGYQYPVRTLESMIRMYYCYYNKDWFGHYYLGSELAVCQSRWRRNWEKKRFFQAAPRDHGKCGWVNSYVVMASGERKMLKDVEVGDSVLTFDENDFKIKPKRIIARLDTGVKPLYELVTRTGRAIKTTGEHRYYTADGWKELKDLVAGEHIAVPREYNNDINRKDLTSKQRSLSRFIGYMIGDGSTLCANFTNADSLVLDDFLMITKDLNLITKERIKKDIGKARCYGLSGYNRNTKSAARFIRHIGLCKTTGHFKMFPEWVFKVNNNLFISELLGSYFDCDGSIEIIDRHNRKGCKSQANIEYVSVNRGLLSQVQSLLLRFGIISILSYKKQVKAYRLCITGKDNQERFCKEISLVGDKKREQLEVLEHLETIFPNTQIDYVPFPASQLLENITPHFLRKDHKVRIDNSYRTGRKKLQKVAEIDGNYNILKWAFSDVLWDTVQRIDYAGEGETCDLQVEDTCSYIANDIVVHNSHVYSFENPLWHICYVDNIRILSASKSDSLAEKYLGAIKRTIETNQRLLEDFGDLTENVNPVDGTRLEGGKGKGGWAKNQLFCRRTNHSLKDGTIESIGWGCAITGSRFDLIILDDPIEESDCKTAKARKAQVEMIHVLEELLEPQGKFHVIGTRKHYDDLYSYLLKNPRWTYSIDKGIVKFPANFKYVFEEDPETGKQIAVDVYIPDGETYEVLWEDKWSIKALLLKKHGSLPLHFLRDIQNEVTSDETSDFPESYITRCRDVEQLGRRVPFLKSRPDWARWVVVGVDLSGVFNRDHAEDRDSDYYTITVLAIGYENYDRHLISACRVRGIDADVQLRKMIACNADFLPDVIILETNAYQKAMEGLAIASNLPVLPHNTGSEKHGIDSGIPRLGIEMKNKYFVFYTGCTESSQYYDILFNELHGYGSETHDDTVMSLWLANLGVTWLVNKHRRRKEREDKRVAKNTEDRVRGYLEEPQKTVPIADPDQKVRKEVMDSLNARLKMYSGRD